MRNLVLMRGIPGSGKSTWIEQNGWKPYTISSDDLRLMFSEPERRWNDGCPSISQKKDKMVWETLHLLVEERMKSGAFTVVDATNINLRGWKKLADKYGYKIWTKTLNTSLEECLRRDSFREPLKRVGEEVIKNMYYRFTLSQNTSVEELLEEVGSPNLLKLETWNGKGKIFVFGDVHGCYSPLQEFFQKNPYSEDNLYVFLGDYLDRGGENKEVLEFFLSVQNLSNFIFLEGNHSWEKLWAQGRESEIRSKEFFDKTLPQIKNISKEEIARFCSRWRLYYYLQVGGKKFFFTHAGFGYKPFQHILSVKDFTKGQSYEDEIDAAWDACAEENEIQVHGHRNLKDYPPNKFSKSINLCSKVEFGSDFPVMEISGDGSWKFSFFRNSTWNGRKNEREKFMKKEEVKSDLEKLRSSDKVREKDLENGISSFSFKRDVFFSGDWDDVSKVARGLFLDNTTGKVVARSYEKFFSYKERDKNSDEWLENNLRFPVTAYRKENGYLGILSCINGELHFFSKSTDKGPFAENFKRIFMEQFGGVANKVKSFLFARDASMVFEVIDPVQDPHIISYPKEELVLLDVIKNKMEMEKECYEFLEVIGNTFGMRVKEKEIFFYTWKQILASGILDEKNKSYITGEFCEGWVLEDLNGYQFKVKTPFYQTWKRRRAVKEKLLAGKELNQKDEEDPFTDVLKSLSKEELELSIIDLRERSKFTSSPMEF